MDHKFQLKLNRDLYQKLILCESEAEKFSPAMPVRFLAG